MHLQELSQMHAQCLLWRVDDLLPHLLAPLQRQLEQQCPAQGAYWTD